jgi:invasion protein IalB
VESAADGQSTVGLNLAQGASLNIDTGKIESTKYAPTLFNDWNADLIP